MMPRRKAPPSLDDNRDVPLSRLVNLGPVTLEELHSMGWTRLSQLDELGWEECCRRWVAHFPDRLNANAFLGLLATLEGVRWTKASHLQRKKARDLARQMRQESLPKKKKKF